MNPNEIIDKFVRVVKVHYMNHTVSGTFSYCIRVEVEFLNPLMYVNGYDTKHIAIYNSHHMLTEEVYNSLFGLYKFCGVSRDDLLMWVVSKIDFNRAWDKDMYGLVGSVLSEQVSFHSVLQNQP
jgi:hypothetical protein